MKISGFFLAVFIFFLSACGESGGLDFEQSFVTIQTASGSTTVLAEIANTEEKQEQGLADRFTLLSDAGMLFVFDDESSHSMSLQNVYLSLDIIFISADQQIVYLEENTTPLSILSVTSTRSSQYVLEVNAGFVQTYGVEVGNVVAF